MAEQAGNPYGYVDIYPNIDLPVEFMQAAAERRQKDLDQTRDLASVLQEKMLADEGPFSGDLPLEFNEEFSYAAGQIVSDLNTNKITTSEASKRLNSLKTKFLSPSVYREYQILQNASKPEAWQGYGREKEAQGLYGSSGMYANFDRETGQPLIATDIEDLKRRYPTFGTFYKPENWQPYLRDLSLKNVIAQQEEGAPFVTTVIGPNGEEIQQLTQTGRKFFDEGLFKQKMSSEDYALAEAAYKALPSNLPLLSQELKKIEKEQGREAALEAFIEMSHASVLGNYYEIKDVNYKNISEGKAGGSSKSDQSPSSDPLVSSSVSDYVDYTIMGKDGNPMEPNPIEALDLVTAENKAKAGNQILQDLGQRIKEMSESFGADIKATQDETGIKIIPTLTGDPVKDANLKRQVKDLEFEANQQWLSANADIEAIENLMEQNGVSRQELFADKNMTNFVLSYVNEEVVGGKSRLDHTLDIAFINKRSELRRALIAEAAKAAAKNFPISGIPISTIAQSLGLDISADPNIQNIEQLSEALKTTTLTDVEKNNILTKLQKEGVEEGLKKGKADKSILAKYRAFEEDLKSFIENKRSIEVPTFLPADEGNRKQVDNAVRGELNNIRQEKFDNVRILGVAKNSQQERDLLAEVAKVDNWDPQKGKYADIDVSNTRIMHSPYGEGFEGIISIPINDKLYNIAVNLPGMANIANDSAIQQADTYHSIRAFNQELKNNNYNGAYLRGPFRDTYVTYVPADLEAAGIKAGTPLVKAGGQIYTADNIEDLLKLNSILNDSRLSTEKDVAEFLNDPEVISRLVPSLKPVNNPIVKFAYGRDLDKRNSIKLKEDGFVTGSKNVQEFMSLVGAAESGKASEENPRSSATGWGQFINSTWADMQKYGTAEERGLTSEEWMNKRTDIETNKRMTAVYASLNEQELMRNGIASNPENLYIMHHFGPSGGLSFLKTKDKTAKAKYFVSDSVINANPAWFKDNPTVDELLRKLKNYLYKSRK